MARALPAPHQLVNASFLRNGRQMKISKIVAGAALAVSLATGAAQATPTINATAGISLGDAEIMPPGLDIGAVFSSSSSIVTSRTGDMVGKVGTFSALTTPTFTAAVGQFF